MFEQTKAFSGFSVDDIAAAKMFYGDTLGVPLTEENGMLSLHVSGGGTILVYPKGAQHSPASYTVLNFPVDDIDNAVDQLTSLGIEILRYPGMGQDDRGIARQGGPLIAWFTDPAGNVLSVLQQ